MRPEAVKDLIEKWLQADAEVRDCKDAVKRMLLEWMQNDAFDFSFFKLKRDVHILRKPVAIWGMAHDWIATYPDTEWSRQTILDINLDLPKGLGEPVRVEIVYNNGDSNHAEIPVNVLCDFDVFKEWYNVQYTNYVDNKVNLATYLKNQEEAASTERFQRWLSEGDAFVQLGLVKITDMGSCRLVRPAKGNDNGK